MLSSAAVVCFYCRRAHKRTQEVHKKHQEEVSVLATDVHVCMEREGRGGGEERNI